MKLGVKYEVREDVKVDGFLLLKIVSKIVFEKLGEKEKVEFIIFKFIRIIFVMDFLEEKFVVDFMKEKFVVEFLKEKFVF